ncbi:extra-large guanine nucleotide-binding protein 1-like isoform X1 [Zingiber officinale]|uniref:extra-large guanine nucleotide-binding protein 1-like isoform X1 n=1 Tax=Zingiber officinale TaxID=94328 RepID=UPI001C4C68CD|nr:extra-large guanine nucleotide-binding protein 1-like isoform X1 [Zingiber officinale]
MPPLLVPSSAEADPEAEASSYSFAAVYDGPPLPYALPRALPVDVERIPFAALAPVTAGPVSLPVVLPLPSPKNPTPLLSSSSPTSVIENYAAVAAAPDSDALGSDGSLEILSSETADVSGTVRFSEEFGGAHDRLSTESPLSSPASAFRSCASEIEEADESSDTPAWRAPIVTFQESGQSNYSTTPAVGTTPVANSEGLRIKKGACYSCSRGNRFTEKESCLACGAKYCGRCVLTTMGMGSMPEGRKCISCIGYPILESNRERLGKSSRLLKRLLSDLEIELLMEAEKNCKSNQLRPEDIRVNGKRLNLEEMFLLQSCPRPPPKLNPGYYWYDKLSGYWGKEGHKPNSIITAHLNVGGHLEKNASKGNTGIQINGREITNAEMKMLKWSGVPCAGNPNYWLSADGTYMEEGQKKVKGKIWGKRRMKLLCPLLSLPFPSQNSKCCEEANNFVKRPLPDNLDKKAIQKLLLIGSDGSGATTVFKQAKLFYGLSFSENECQDIKIMIQTTIYRDLALLLECREWFEEDILTGRRGNLQFDSSGGGVYGATSRRSQGDETDFSLVPRLKSFADWLLKVLTSGNFEAIFPASSLEYATLVEELWKNSAIQATYKRRSELRLLPSIRSYFLERVIDITRDNYEPSNVDIINADGINSSNGIASTELQLPSTGSSIDDHEQRQTISRYQLIRGPYKGAGERNCKWLDMFEDTRMVIFCIALTDYDEYYIDTSGAVINKMIESRRLFESIVSNPTFEEKDFLLILSKFDLFDQKLETTPLSLCEWFNNFHPLVSSHPPKRNNTSCGSREATKAEQAFHYVAREFKTLFQSITGRKLYVTHANGLDSDSVNAALQYAREIICWTEEWSLGGGNVESMYSTEPSSTSHSLLTEKNV